MGFIYKITNTLDQKIYIGLTTKTNPKRRFAEHNRYGFRWKYL